MKLMKLKLLNCPNCGAPLPDAFAPPTNARKREKRHDGTRGTGLIAVVKMIHLRRIEIDRFLDQSQTQNARVEIHIALRIVSQRCHMVYSIDEF